MFNSYRYSSFKPARHDHFGSVYQQNSLGNPPLLTGYAHKSYINEASPPLRLVEDRITAKLVKGVLAPPKRASFYARNPLIEENATRIFDLHEDLSCALRTTSSAEPDDYVALSYAWGDRGANRATVPLNCGFGETLQVGKNLADALTAIRKLWQRWRPDGMTSQSVPGLWADAISIDQTNERERFEQVMMMRKIYRKARCLIISLGPLSDPRHQKVLKRLEMEGIPDIMADTSTELLRDVCNDLLGRDWFYRRWIIQEVAVSEKVYADPVTLQIAREYPELRSRAEELKKRFLHLHVDADTLDHETADPNTLVVNKEAIINAFVEDGCDESKLRTVLCEMGADHGYELTFTTYLNLCSRLRRQRQIVHTKRTPGDMLRSMSRRYCLIGGTTLTTFETLIDFIQAIGAVPRPLQPLAEGRWRKLNLLQNLFLYEEAKCTDPRDIVYALYGISVIPKGVKFTWSAQTTIDQLCKSVAGQFARTSQVALLLLVTLGRGLNNASWKPDWRKVQISYASDHHRKATELCRADLLARTTTERRRFAIETTLPGVFVGWHFYVPGYFACRYHGFCDYYETCVSCAEYSFVTKAVARRYVKSCKGGKLFGARTKKVRKANNLFSQWLKSVPRGITTTAVAFLLPGCQCVFFVERTGDLNYDLPPKAGKPFIDNVYRVVDCAWMPQTVYESVFSTLRIQLVYTPLVGPVRRSKGWRVVKPR